MLFDLQGKRRRVVQATYLALAVLMGGGLVFFGIGGDVSGGLFDAFGDRNSGGGNDLVDKRIERNEKALAKKPTSEAALKELVRDHFSKATTSSGTQGFTDDAKKDLRTSAAYWQRYLKLEKDKPDASLATVALQVYDVGALNKPKDATEAARIIAEAQNEANAYIRLVQYATLAKDTRLANLAGQKAIDLAPKAERADVKAQVEQAKQPPQAAQGQGG